MKAAVPSGLGFVESLSVELMVRFLNGHEEHGWTPAVDVEGPASFKSVMSVNALTLDEQIVTSDPGFSQ